MKKTVLYILSILLVLGFTGCKDDFDPNGNLEPSLYPNLINPSEAMMTVSFSEFTSEENWDTEDDANIVINNNDFGNDQDWDENDVTNSDFNLGSWPNDTNWNNE